MDFQGSKSVEDIVSDFVRSARTQYITIRHDSGVCFQAKLATDFNQFLANISESDDCVADSNIQRVEVRTLSSGQWIYDSSVSRHQAWPGTLMKMKAWSDAGTQYEVKIQEQHVKRKPRPQSPPLGGDCAADEMAKTPSEGRKKTETAVQKALSKVEKFIISNAKGVVDHELLGKKLSRQLFESSRCFVCPSCSTKTQLGDDYKFSNIRRHFTKRRECVARFTMPLDSSRYGIALGSSLETRAALLFRQSEQPVVGAQLGARHALCAHGMVLAYGVFVRFAKTHTEPADSAVFTVQEVLVNAPLHLLFDEQRFVLFDSPVSSIGKPSLSDLQGKDVFWSVTSTSVRDVRLEVQRHIAKAEEQ